MFKVIAFFAVVACLAVFALANPEPEPKPQLLYGGYGYGGLPVASYGAYGVYPGVAALYR